MLGLAAAVRDYESPKTVVHEVLPNHVLAISFVPWSIFVALIWGFVLVGRMLNKCGDCRRLYCDDAWCLWAFHISGELTAICSNHSILLSKISTGVETPE